MAEKPATAQQVDSNEEPWEPWLKPWEVAERPTTAQQVDSDEAREPWLKPWEVAERPPTAG